MPSTHEEKTEANSRTSARLIGVQLSVMMFLEYAARGVWYPYLPNYLQNDAAHGGLGFTSAQVGWVFVLASAIGAMVSPIVAGQLADRYLNAEKALALLLVPSGALLLWQAKVRAFPMFMALALVQSLAYMPTMPLANGISFSHLKKPERSFPMVRAWGTIGWAVASFLFSLWFLKGKDSAEAISHVAWALIAGGGFCLVLSAWSVFCLPRTPPKRSSSHPLAFLEAFGLLRERTMLLLVLVAVPVSVIHSAFYIRVGPFMQQVLERDGIDVKWLGPSLAIGQVSEVAALFLLGWMLKRWGYRVVFSIALAAFALRFALFAWGRPAGLVIAGASLHGICFACFYGAAYVFVEKIAPVDARHSAQTLFNLIALGIGPILAGAYNGFFDQFTIGGAQDFRAFWWTEAGVAVVCLLITAICRWEISAPAC